MLRSLPLPNLNAVTRQSAKEYFDNSWTLYETLFAGLNGEEYFYRPPVHGLRHPQIFYYGHTPCLYINKLRVTGVIAKPANAYFESIFEVGVDEFLWDDMHKNDMMWPAVSEVHEYRARVYERVVDAIMRHPSLDDTNGPVKVDQDHPMWALFMGFEHERIHFETSSVLFREAPYHLVQVCVVCALCVLCVESVPSCCRLCWTRGIHRYTSTWFVAQSAAELFTVVTCSHTNPPIVSFRMHQSTDSKALACSASVSTERKPQDPPDRRCSLSRQQDDPGEE